MDGSFPLPTLSAADLRASEKLDKPQGPDAKKAAQDFEAVFLAQMLQPMFDTVEVDPMFGGGSGEETWRGLMVEEMGKQIARSGGVGLADFVEKEMLRLQEVADGKR
jgi:Rod binding domain-containing protein